MPGIEIGADALLIATDVDAVHADGGTPEQRPIGSITDTQALLRGEAGTRVTVEAAVPTG